jgi:hypothetical protein
MKIKYRTKQLNFNLFSGLLWLVLGSLRLFTEENYYWMDYWFLALSFFYLGTYFYEKKQGYLTLEQGVISRNRPFGKRIPLNEVTRIKKFAGDFILKTNQLELTINTQIIDEKSLVLLIKELELQHIEWN